MLKVSLYSSKPLRWWYEQNLSNKIDMSPSYQRRGEIWSKWKRAYLIDSILNDFDIPKFYVASLYDSSSDLNEKNKSFSIIDGKQRLGAIFSFFNDEFPLNPSFVYDDQPEIHIGKFLYSDLRNKHPHIARKFDEFIPTVMDVFADKKSRIEDLFVRLNMGEAANAAERRNAMQGPVPHLVREIATHPFFVNKIRFNTKRMQEFNLITKLLMLEYHGDFSDTKAKNLDEFSNRAVAWVKENVSEDGLSESNLLGPYRDAANRILEVLELLNSEFNESDPLLSKQGEIPIYYWLAKKHPTKVNELRDFVLEFSESLLSNLRSQRDDHNTGIGELNAYYTMSRTTNDAQSYQGRFKILEKRFLDFIRAPGRKH